MVWSRTDVLIYLITIFPIITFLPGHFIYNSFFWKDPNSDFDFFQRLFVKILISMIVSTFMGLCLLSCGYFKMLFLVYGNLIFSLMIAFFYKYKITRIDPINWEIQPWHAGIVIFIIVGVYLQYRPTEWLIGNTIEPAHAIYAFHLFADGMWAITNSLWGLKGELIDLIYSQKSFGFFEGGKTGLLINSNFLFPMWMSFFAGLFGPKMMFYTNSFLATVVLLGAYTFGKLLFSRSVGVFLCALFLLHAGTIWQAHHNNSDLLALFFVIGLLVAFTVNWKKRCSLWKAIGFSSLLFIFFTQKSAVFFVLIGMVFVLMSWILYRRENLLIWLVMPCLASFTAFLFLVFLMGYSPLDLSHVYFWTDFKGMFLFWFVYVGIGWTFMQLNLSQRTQIQYFFDQSNKRWGNIVLFALVAAGIGFEYQRVESGLGSENGFLWVLPIFLGSSYFFA